MSYQNQLYKVYIQTSGYLPVQSVSRTIMVSIGVLDEIELMVLLRIPPLTAFDDLCNNCFTCDAVWESDYHLFLEEKREVGAGITFGCKILCLNLLGDTLCDGELVI